MGSERYKAIGTEKNEQMRKENGGEAAGRVKEEDAAGMVPTSSIATEPEVRRRVRPEVEVLKSAVNKLCVIRNTSVSDLKDEYELDAGSVISENVHPVIADPQEDTRSAWD